MEKMKKIVTGLDEVEKERNVAWILDLACRNESIARGVHGETVNSKVCAEVRADLVDVPSVIHHLTLTQTHMFSSLTPPSHYYLIDFFV